MFTSLQPSSFCDPPHSSAQVHLSHLQKLYGMYISDSVPSCSIECTAGTEVCTKGQSVTHTLHSCPLILVMCVSVFCNSLIICSIHGMPGSGISLVTIVTPTAECTKMCTQSGTLAV